MLSIRPHRPRARRVVLSSALVPLAAVAALTQGAHARDAFTTYGSSYRAFAAPPSGIGSFGVVGDALPDGRLVMLTGASIYLESAPRSGSFSIVASLDPAIATTSDPGFLTVSPDGSRLALGLGFGKPVVVVPTTQLGTPALPRTLTGASVNSYNLENYQAAWADNTLLAITSATSAGSVYSGSVTLLDTTSSPASPSTRTLITNITGASGGIAFDAAGNLYTSNGFANTGSPTPTGAVRAFPASILSAASPVAFTTGTNIGTFLSASSLAFDAEGNLFAGGGDFSAEFGYLALARASALSTALAGLGPVNLADLSQFKRLTPPGTGYYAAVVNRATGEAYATDTDFLTGANTWYATIPAPGTLLLAPALTLLAARRRRAN